MHALSTVSFLPSYYKLARGCTFILAILKSIIYYNTLIILHSNFLYSISHPGKNGTPLIDLSSDDEAKVTTEGLTSHQIIIDRVIKKIFFKYGITLDITNKVKIMENGANLV